MSVHSTKTLGSFDDLPRPLERMVTNVDQAVKGPVNIRDSNERQREGKHLECLQPQAVRAEGARGDDG